MALDDFATLLADLADAFGEPVIWQGRIFIGRFRIDPFVVPLPPTGAGLGETETWLYCERAAIPGGIAPDIGAVLLIRGRAWEVVEVGEDDLGELALRLIKYEGEALLDADEDVDFRRPGRPTRRDEIARAYAAIAPTLAADVTTAQVFAAIRKRLTGSATETVGLSDKTLRKVIASLRHPHA